MIESIEFKINYLSRKIKNFLLKKPIIKNTEETIDYLINNKVSVVRFGDGEFDLILQNRSLGFQSKNELLRKNLISILENTDSKILVCIPYTIISTKHLNKKAYDFWNLYTNRYYSRIREYLNFDSVYFDSLFTRLYMDYEIKNKSDFLFKRVFQIWNNQDIIIVEGEFSKLGVDNNVFINVNSLKRILCPSKDAYQIYDNILDTILIYAKKDNLILISLGPTATVLAADLAKKGFWAIDIGHIDVEYEWMRLGANEKVSIKNRKVWESVNGQDFNTESQIDNEEYINSIISIISPHNVS